MTFRSYSLEQLIFRELMTKNCKSLVMTTIVPGTMKADELRPINTDKNEILMSNQSGFRKKSFL